MSRAYIGVGGNLGDVVTTINSAIAQLRQNSNIESITLSSFYRSKPLGNTEQPQYINAVAMLDTSLLPHDLLCLLQETELQFGRVRTEEQWSSRTLDLDILLFDELQISDDALTIPHAGLLVRDFVLEPLNELAPAVTIAGYGSLAMALESCENRGLQKL